jgi:hypothetical protein
MMPPGESTDKGHKPVQCHFVRRTLKQKRYTKYGPRQYPGIVIDMALGQF